MSLEVAAERIRPAVEISLSVSRVGSASQIPSFSYLSKKLKQDVVVYQNFKGLEKLSGGADPAVSGIIARGRRIYRYFTQELYQSSRIFSQIISMYLLSAGYLDSVSEMYVGIFLAIFFNFTFASQYLAPSLYQYVYYPDDLEGFLIAYDFPLLEARIASWADLYSSFFAKEVVTRLSGNTLALILQTLGGIFNQNEVF